MIITEEGRYLNIFIALNRKDGLEREKGFSQFSFPHMKKKREKKLRKGAKRK